MEPRPWLSGGRCLPRCKFFDGCVTLVPFVWEMAEIPTRFHESAVAHPNPKIAIALRGLRHYFPRYEVRLHGSWIIIAWTRTLYENQRIVPIRCSRNGCVGCSEVISGDLRNYVFSPFGGSYNRGVPDALVERLLRAKNSSLQDQR